MISCVLSDDGSITSNIESCSPPSAESSQSKYAERYFVQRVSMGYDDWVGSSIYAASITSNVIALNGLSGASIPYSETAIISSFMSYPTFEISLSPKNSFKSSLSASAYITSPLGGFIKSLLPLSVYATFFAALAAEIRSLKSALLPMPSIVSVASAASAALSNFSFDIKERKFSRVKSAASSLSL